MRPPIVNVEMWRDESCRARLEVEGREVAWVTSNLVTFAHPDAGTFLESFKLHQNQIMQQRSITFLTASAKNVQFYSPNKQQ